MIGRAVGAAKRLSRSFRRMPTWRGVYARHADVPARGGYGSALWIEGTQRYLKEARTGHALPEGDRVMLAMLVAALTNGGARILDYGGGMGLDCALLRNALGPTAVGTYTVVEVPQVVEVGRMLAPDVQFVSSLDEATGSFDIVYVRSALQYAVDPLGTLRQLLGYRAPHVLLLDLAAGDLPTFVTAQLNVPGSVLPYWFVNIDSVEVVVRDAGYRIAMRTLAEARRVRSDLPPGYRLDRTTNLLLRLAAAQ